jgi:hypothetical protein
LGPASFDLNRLLTAQATQGKTTADLAAGALHVFDRTNVLTVTLFNGALSSISEEELLQGGNAAAVGSYEDGWEILQFQTAELIAQRTYRLSRLLRGQSGSDPELLPLRPAGSRFVLLNAAIVQPDLSLVQSELMNTWRIGPAAYDIGRAHVDFEHQCKRLGLRPLPPCRLRAQRLSDRVRFTWIRRTRIDGDGWGIADVPLGEQSEVYALEIVDGADAVRAVELVQPTFDYMQAEIAADFGSDPGAFTLRIAQLSAVYGPGAALQRTLDV